MLDQTTVSRGDLVERFIFQEYISKLSPGDKLPSERELAKQCGVAVQTVNKILVSLTDQHVLERRLGRGTFIAQRKASGKIFRLLSHSPELFDPSRHVTWYNSQFIMEGFTAAAREHGLFVEVYFMPFDKPPTGRQVRELLHPEVSGYALHVYTRPDHQLELLRVLSAHGKAVVARSYGPCDVFPTVYGLMREGVAEAVGHLLDRGRRRIAYLSSTEESTSYEDVRREGYVDAHRARGLAPDPALEFPSGCTDEAGYAAMRAVLERGLTFDAVFTGTDIRAFGVLRALADAGVRVPDDVAVVGSDDLPECRRQTPPLATVRYPMHAIGHAMAEILRESLVNPGVTPMNRALPCRFIPRASCGGDAADVVGMADAADAAEKTVVPEATSAG